MKGFILWQEVFLGKGGSVQEEVETQESNGSILKAAQRLREQQKEAEEPEVTIGKNGKLVFKSDKNEVEPYNEFLDRGNRPTSHGF